MNNPLLTDGRNLFPAGTKVIIGSIHHSATCTATVVSHELLHEVVDDGSCEIEGSELYKLQVDGEVPNDLKNTTNDGFGYAIESEVHTMEMHNAFHSSIFYPIQTAETIKQFVRWARNKGYTDMQICDYIEGCL